MKQRRLFLLVTLSVTFLSCNAPREVSLNTMPPVAVYSVVNGDSVLTCDLAKIRDTIYYDFSEFCERADLTEPMQYVALDTRPEAMVMEHVPVVMSENYILVQGMNQVPHKVFDLQGNWLGSIGPFAELGYVLCLRIDEAHKRVLLMAATGRWLYSCSFDGSDVRKYFLSNSNTRLFYLNKVASSITAVGIGAIWDDKVPLILKLDFEGNRIDSVFARTTSFPLVHQKASQALGHKSFAEMTHNGNTPSFDIFLNWRDYLGSDTLYHYDEQKKRFVPRYAPYWSNRKGYYSRSVIELPRYYLGSYSRMEKIKEEIHPQGGRSVFYSQRDHKEITYFIEKSTGRGAILEGMGTLTGKLNGGFYNGYYVRMRESKSIIASIDYELRKGVSPERSEYLFQQREKLLQTRNLCIGYARLKP